MQQHILGEVLVLIQASFVDPGPF